MRPIIADQKLIAYCGLYCGACKRYLKEKCPGCFKNERAQWCKIRQCCIERAYVSCADCRDYKNANDCTKFNNVLSRFFGFIMNSDRQACVRRLKAVGAMKYAEEMASQGIPSIKKR